MPSTCFREAFRVDPPVVRKIEEYIGRYLQRDTRRNHALTAKEQILITLHFLGNGSQYHINGHLHGVNKSTICRSVHNVCWLIARYIMPSYVRWPTNSTNVNRLFERKAGFPNVKGIIDGTLVYIIAPHQDEPSYVARNNRHAINVLLVSGPHHEFFFASAKCPGSFHDSRVLRVSKLWQNWELNGWRPDNDENGTILGDSAYPLRRWLMTPTIRNMNASIPHLEEAVPIFLRKHRKTRFMVECAIGILKAQFPCFNGFRMKDPKRICVAIYACVTLHNMQNHYRHGSYRYDDRLQGIINREPEIAVENELENRLLVDANDDNEGINVQRRLLEYFLNREE